MASWLGGFHVFGTRWLITLVTVLMGFLILKRSRWTRGAWFSKEVLITETHYYSNRSISVIMYYICTSVRTDYGYPYICTKNSDTATLFFLFLYSSCVTYYNLT